MKLGKSIIALSSIMLLGTLFLASPSFADAAEYSRWSGSRYCQYRDNDGNCIGRRVFHRWNQPAVRIVNFHNLRNRFWWWRDSDWNRDFLHARRIVVVDRNNWNNQITVNASNYMTGPYSRNVNQVTVRVDSDFFREFSNAVDVSSVNNIDMELNTGNNTISANTVVGNISTGDIDVSIR